MFEKETIINIRDFTINEYAYNPEIGEKISSYIEENFDGKSKLILDFKDIKSINTAFANKIVHGLYKNYSSDILNKYFRLKNYNSLISETIKKVIENYKEVKNDL